MTSSLEALSGFYEDNSLKSRRNLRGDVEKRSMSINKQYLDAFAMVEQVSLWGDHLHIFDMS